MSHVVGSVLPVPSPIHLGPDAGPPTDGPDTWSVEFTPEPASGGTKLVMLHFTAATLPGSNRVEVDLGYGGADTMDVFTSADGADFWTRPINLAAFGDAQVPIRYIRNGGGATGGVTLGQYGRGERHAGEQDPTSLSNCDPFLLDAVYVEPDYDPFWYCADPPNWENIAQIPSASDIRRTVARSVGMVYHADGSHLSTCSVTLVGPDLVLTAGHCMAQPAEHAKSSSVIFNYETEADGSRPAGYAGRFFKVKEVIAQHWNTATDDMDYCLFRLKVPPGLPSIQMRHDIPGAGEQVFGIHHPNGAVKKLSIPHSGFATVQSSDVNNVRVPNNFHVSGGSSGSGLFDAVGRVVGVLADGDPCGNVGPSSQLRYYPTASILQQVAEPPADPPITRDVMIVFDRSGSMSLAGSSGRPKIDEARDAASLFVQLILAGTGNRLGLVSFSTSAVKDFTLHDVTDGNKASLVGPPPFSGGKIGDLDADGNTTIGGGLKKAAEELPDGASNPRTILLLTDGLQNTPPMIGEASVQNALAGIGINAIGYGTAANLDGPLLDSLAQAHGGTYVRADSLLQLEKYFSQAFGNIFESGLLTDPEFVMKAEERRATPFPFNICDEEAVTVVVGWDNLDTTLFIEVVTPDGATIHAGAPGTESATGRAWTFLRVPLPQNGEREGAWNVVVFRPGGGGEFPPPAPATRYFINVIAKGGPRLERVPDARTYYTGDTINPMVFLSYPSGGSPENVQVKLKVTGPRVSAGNLLSQERLHQPSAAGGDTIPALQATMQAIEARTGGPAIVYGESEVEMSEGPGSTGGAFESVGLFGGPMKDLLAFEGDYTFHAVATYGEGCISSRELQWSIHVGAAVDPGRTDVTVVRTGTRVDGRATGTVTITPRDPFGNLVGPGRDLTVSGTPGTTVTGPATDNGDGTYTVPVAWDPESGEPGVVVGQPGRPPVVLTPPGTGPEGHSCRWCWLIALLLLLLSILLLWLYWFK
ncbi:MAG TPA: trypsin-like peptidase domain-containing protein [Allosphingosinicella sp.]|nr:trypsin-like peptidase domain-containing protein [Allosphingosinicella sp.]